MDFDYLVKVRPKNITKFDPHPAKSFGATSRAAISAILGGFLPHCRYPNCYHHQIHLPDPYFLTNLKADRFLYLAVPNGWCLELLKPFIYDELWNKLSQMHTKHTPYTTKELVDDFLKIVPKHDKYFAYFHVMETHPPFYTPEKIDDTEERRKSALLWIDEVIKPLLELDSFTLIMADHNLEHDFPTGNTLDVFIAGPPKKWKEVL
jgi:hypothetical protein